MYKKKIFNGLKVLVIFFLVIGIAFLIMIQWKSDTVIRKVVSLIQHQMEDSLVYDDISLEWFRQFPSTTLRIEGLNIGNDQAPFIRGGSVDVVLRLFPLLKEQIIINKLIISDCTLHVTKHKGRWTYELFKKTEEKKDIQNAEVSATDDSKWKALVRQLVFINTVLIYNNKEGTGFFLDIKEGNIGGNLTGDSFDSKIDMSATLDSLQTSSYNQAQKLQFELKGKYNYDAIAGTQELKNWTVEMDGIDLDVNGLIRKEANHHWMNISVQWEDADPQALKALLPQQSIKDWNNYLISGKSEGQVEIKGNSTDSESPNITFSSELKNGSIRFPGEGGQLKNILLNLAYDSGVPHLKKPSYLRANLRNSSFEGNKLSADMRIENLDNPLLEMEMKGSFPVSLLNIFMDSATWNFKEGLLKMDHYKIQNLNIKNFTTRTFIGKSAGKLTSSNVHFNYNGDDIKINDGEMQLNNAGKMRLKVNEFIWNNAFGEDIVGEIQFAGENVNFDLKGKHSEGQILTKGTLSGMGTKPILNADWQVEGIEMKELLKSFNNFDQTFITSEHLNGKADIWAHSTIPYDKAGNIKPREAVIRAAIEIKDGKLKGLKTLEDFSKYVHLDDLREIKFNEFRNYMKIEDGKVYLPVMFIQSSAVNLSINGVHSFDQEILYNLKINAGQVAGNKLKKFDPLKKLKPAKKSGWINMYFILSGTVSDVKYEKDQRQVISSFEQSSQQKESLRNYLVDRFGHEVYWLEPNEWEDIPEYK